METVLDAPQDCNPRLFEHGSELPSLAQFFEDTSTGDYAAIPTMFGSASSKLKKPKLWLGELTLKLATGSRTKWPGSVHVLVGTLYHATISTAGVLYVRHKLPESALTLLAKLASDPITTILEVGQLQGRCCFCHRSLTDPRSACHGYGARCAEIWGLRWDAPRAYRGLFGDVWNRVSGAEL